MLKLVQFFIIQFGDEDEDKSIEISKDSLMKIFDLVGLSSNERLSRIQFYEVEEEVEYEEEDDDEEDDLYDLPSSRSRKIKMNIVSDTDNNKYYNPNTTFEIEKRIRTTTTTYPENSNDKINHKIRNNKVIKENFIKNYKNEKNYEIKKETIFKTVKTVKKEINKLNSEINEEKNKKHYQN